MTRELNLCKATTLQPYFSRQRKNYSEGNELYTDQFTAKSDKWVAQGNNGYILSKSIGRFFNHCIPMVLMFNGQNWQINRQED
jgi:hypothetical protein